MIRPLTIALLGACTNRVYVGDVANGDGGSGRNRDADAGSRNHAGPYSNADRNSDSDAGAFGPTDAHACPFDGPATDPESLRKTRSRPAADLATH